MRAIFRLQAVKMSTRNSTFSGRPVLRRALFAAAACLFVYGLAACGGSTKSEPTSQDFRSICQDYKECLGDADFEQNYGTVDLCAENYESSYEDLTGSCKEAASESVLCEANNFQCMQGGPATPPECEDDVQKTEEECQSSR
jgi:hypothetical protein